MTSLDDDPVHLLQDKGSVQQRNVVCSSTQSTGIMNEEGSSLVFTLRESSFNNFEMNCDVLRLSFKGNPSLKSVFESSSQVFHIKNNTHANTDL